MGEVFERFLQTRHHPIRCIGGYFPNLHFIGIGEHHRRDFAVSSPEMVLAAIAARTERIRLGSAVTVLSSDDPVRVFERFSTLDAVSNGRAEIVVGRGSFTESFPLFGLDLAQYEELFEDRLDLFAALLEVNTYGAAKVEETGKASGPGASAGSGTRSRSRSGGARSKS